MDSLVDRRAAMELALETNEPVKTYRELVGGGRSLAVLKTEDAIFVDLVKEVKARAPVME